MLCFTYLGSIFPKSVFSVAKSATKGALCKINRCIKTIEYSHDSHTLQNLKCQIKNTTVEIVVAVVVVNVVKNSD